MNKKLIKKLAQASYDGYELDENKTKKIVFHLKRKELKEYIKYLKEIRKNFSVYIDHSSDLEESLKNELKNLFSGKEVVFRKNPDLIAGLRITENDIVYNLNLKNSLQRIKKYFYKYL